jgi:hypothetical protein
MSIVIAVILLLFGGWLWKEHKAGTLQDRPNWLLAIVLYGVKNHSPIGFIVMIVVFAVFRMWFLLAVTVALWVLYAGLQKSIKEKETQEQK